MAGEIFVVSAPSGAGKTTLLKQLVAADPMLRFSVSYTTRNQRPGEVQGEDYFFVSPSEFQRLKDAGELVEWVEQFGYAYGTSRDWVRKTLESGTDLIFDLETRGARALKGEFPQGTFIFILPPTLEQLERRLQVRGDLSPVELARRLEQGRRELTEVHWYDFLVVNDEVSRALKDLQAIIQACRLRASRLWPQLANRFRA